MAFVGTAPAMVENMSKFVASLIIAILAGSACRGGKESLSPHPGSSDNIELIDGLLPHHQAAIEMADMVIARGANPEVVMMAKNMRTVQMGEIATMRSKRSALTKGESSSPGMRDRHMEADMSDLQKLTGAALDRAFLDDMIPHHAGAIQLAHRSLRGLTDSDLRTLAEMTIVNQTREMNEMLALRQRL